MHSVQKKYINSILWLYKIFVEQKPHGNYEVCFKISVRNLSSILFLIFQLYHTSSQIYFLNSQPV